jgi:ATP-binding cassette subfamily F protein 2
MAGELQPTLGDIRPHGHLKLGRFTQHFVDVLDLEKTPLEFFEEMYPNDPREEQRKYLGRFGVSGAMQVQKMAELSDGQKSRVVFAKLGRDVPHIVRFYTIYSTSVCAIESHRHFPFVVPSCCYSCC